MFYQVSRIKSCSFNKDGDNIDYKHQTSTKATSSSQLLTLATRQPKLQGSDTGNALLAKSYMTIKRQLTDQLLWNHTILTPIILVRSIFAVLHLIEQHTPYPFLLFK